MNIALLVGSALRRLSRYKAKTFLMGFGILISVLATILVQAVSANVRDSFTRFVERVYPSDTVALVAGSGFMGGGTGRNKLRMEDLEAVVGSVAQIKEWDPILYAGSRDIKRGANSLRVGIVGYSEKAETARRRSVSSGDFLSADQIRRMERVALIGSTTAKRLFPDQSPVGETLFIDNSPFEVIGILESVGVDPHGNDQDNTIHVPYTTLKNQILRVDYISGAIFVLEDRNQVERTRQTVTEVMRSQHGIGPGQDDDFSVLTAAQLQQLLDRSFRTFNIFVPLIAGLIFLVSGLVILGIMLISIRDRAAEIGLRKAVGARPADLQLQIIVEVLCVSCIAALVGLVLAYVGLQFIAPILAKKFGATAIHLPLSVVLISFGLAIVTGVFGAIVPARRAARLNPVESLR